MRMFVAFQHGKIWRYTQLFVSRAANTGWTGVRELESHVGLDSHSKCSFFAMLCLQLAEATHRPSSHTWPASCACIKKQSRSVIVLRFRFRILPPVAIVVSLPGSTSRLAPGIDYSNTEQMQDSMLIADALSSLCAESEIIHSVPINRYPNN